MIEIENTVYQKGKRVLFLPLSVLPFAKVILGYVKLVTIIISLWFYYPLTEYFL